MTDDIPPGQALRDWRKAHGVFQSVLAGRLGTTQSRLSRIETGKASPDLPLALRISAVCRIAVGRWPAAEEAA